LLQEVFRSGFRYCEFYTPDGCCRSVPCTRVGDAEIFYQKNHDFDFSVRTDLKDVVYVIQYRDPVMALLSDREYLATMQGEERAADRDEYVIWLGRKAYYFAHFFEKWLRRRLPNQVPIDYDDLVSDPARVLEGLFAMCRREVSPAALRAAIERAAPKKAFPSPGAPDGVRRVAATRSDRRARCEAPARSRRLS
jgi:hypothetical protein